MKIDTTDLIMQKYFIEELKKSINRDVNILAEKEAILKRQCNHPSKYLKPANISYDMDAKRCTLCEQII